MAETEFRPRARVPRGFSDRRARDLAGERRILEAVAGVYERYGFEQLATPAFEYADALGKFLPDADRPNEGVFALQDDPDAEGNGQWLALRYDLTAPLARFVAENWQALPKPFRRYAFGPVWRNEKPGPGRYREFIQCDADSVGSARPESDAEIIAMAADGLEAAGLRRGAYVLKINDRKLLDGVLDELDVFDARQRLAVLRALDKADRLGWEGVAQLLGEGRMDESGAYTKGAQLPPAAVEAVLRFASVGGDGGRRSVLDKLGSLTGPFGGAAALADLARIDEALTRMGVGDDRARFDVSVVRGLEYYTGPVFEAELLIEATDERGQPVSFGSVGGGGRYDDLVARFTGEQVPATGFSFGVSRLAAALRATGMEAGAEGRGPVVVIAFDEAGMGEYFAAAAELRNAGVSAEVYLGASGMRAQMKYADRRLSPAAVILGGDELANGTVTIKNLDLGRELAGGLKDNTAWRAERPGQVNVPRAEMAAAVRRIVEGAPRPM